MQYTVLSENDPVCTGDISWYPLWEGNAKFSCSVNYHGSWPPSMECRNGTTTLDLRNESSDSTAKFSGAVNITRWDDGLVYICRVFFELPRKRSLPPRQPHEAANLPSYSATFTTHKITVHCAYRLKHFVKNVSNSHQSGLCIVTEFTLWWNVLS